MSYERIKKVKGRIYLQLVAKGKVYDHKTKTWKVKQKVLCQLGNYDFILKCYRKVEAEYFALRKGREDDYLTDEEGGCWNYLMKMEEWLRQDEKQDFKRSEVLQKQEDLIASWPEGEELPCPRPPK